MGVGDRNRGRRVLAAGAVGLVTAVLLGLNPGLAQANGQTPSSSSGVGTTAAFGLPASAHGLGLKLTPPLQAAQFKVKAVTGQALRRSALPASVDLTQFAPPAADQGQISSCVSWAVAYDLMGYYSKKLGHDGAPFAPMYLYSQVNDGVDEGSTFADNFRLLASQGVDTKADYRPQGDFGWQQKPTAAQKVSASFHRALAPTMLFAGGGQGANARLAMSNALAAGQPVVIGIAVYTNFFYLGGGKTTFTNADATGQLLGYHAVTAFGYNANGVIIENSWGAGWGNQGFATLGWDFVQKSVIEAWTTAGFANATVAAAPTSWSSTGAGTPATFTSQAPIFGKTAAAFNALNWRLTIGGATVPLSWKSSTQASFKAPAGAVGAANIVLTHAGVSSVISTPVAYVPSISGMSIAERADGTRLVTVSGAGLSGGSQWQLLSPSGSMSPLTISASNNISSGAVNRIWAAPDGRSAILLVGAVDPVIREAGAYGVSYVSASGNALLTWASGGIPFLAPTITAISTNRVRSQTGADVTISGAGMAAFMAGYPAGVRLVSDATGLATDLVIKTKTTRSVTVSIPVATAVGSYHFLLSTPLGTAANAAGSLSVV